MGGFGFRFDLAVLALGFSSSFAAALLSAGSAAGVFLAIAYLGMTPLHVTAWFGHKELTELLLAKGADVNAKSNYGTPLDLTNQQGKTETANLLRKHGGKTREELQAKGE